MKPDISLSDPTPWYHKKVGLLGGSFNPAHDGHRTMSLYALERLGLDAVWWLVSPQNPLKSPKDMAPMEERLAEAKKIAHHPQILPTVIESEMGTQYTIDTLTGLKQHFPETMFVWLMGDENLIQLPLWRNWESILHSVPIAVFRRLGYTQEVLNSEAARKFKDNRISVDQALQLPKMKAPAWILLENPLHPASATAIRERRKT